MNHFSDTVVALSKITDTGLFENLAAAVLRRAEPALYANLTQPGVNAEGKPVKGPVDALSFVAGASPPHMVAAHHTTCAQVDLRKKWLHDPAAVTPRVVGRPSASAGDIVKTAAIVSSERERAPNIRVTLALTTNEEPPEDVSRDAESFARRSGIVLDIWSRSRIADYLDHHPDGQWLRKKYLRIEQERLSFDLLRELSLRSLDAHRPPAHEEALIERDVTIGLTTQLPRPLGFVVGESGFGKTLASYQLLRSHIQNGGCGLVLPHEILASSATLDQAIDAALRQLHLVLAPASGTIARTLCSTGNPLLLVVEDINRSGQSAALIERLVKWAFVGMSKKDEAEVSWRAVCPIWPQLVTALSDETRKRVECLGLQLGPYTQGEARTVIQRRAAFEGLTILPFEADEIAQALGNDPLLIALHDLRGVPNAEQVIAQFIAQSAERLAYQGGTHSAYEYETGLRTLAREILQRRCIDPSWSEVLGWFSHSPDQLAILRELTKHAEIIRVSGSTNEAKIAFRHDRVQKRLLVAAAIEALRNNNLDEEIFAEPFFADVIGSALAHESATTANAVRAKAVNPLALFYALQAFREPTTGVHQAILSAIDEWLADEGSHTLAYETLRHWALNVLADTQSSYVVEIVKRFRDKSWGAHLACLRNGDLSGGVRLCNALEPGSGALWRDYSIEYAKVKYGTTLIKELDALLRREHLSETEIVGGLRLAGHFGDSALANAIWQCWQSDQQRVGRVDEYLWAIAQCGGEHTSQLLTPVCDAWASFSDKPEKEHSISARHAVVEGHLRWAFWRKLSQAALRYLIDRAGSDDKLRSNIMYLLHGIDDPDAVEFVAREIARGLKEIEGTNKFWPFVRNVAEHWERKQRERGGFMSPESRQRLRMLWENKNEEKHLRIQAFRVWAATMQPDDLPLLQRIDPACILGDDVLRARLKRDDKSAVALFIEKIRNDKKAFWWQYARDFWSDELTKELDAEFSRRGAAIEKTWKAHYPSDWVTADLVTRLDASTAEKILVKHWEHLRFSSGFMQAAIYTATPCLLELVRQAMSECSDKADVLKYITRHFGIRMSGHPGVLRVEQVEALVPYLDYLDDKAIHDLWELCNERGWMALRKARLDARLAGQWRERSGLDDGLIMGELYKELDFERVPWMDLWVDRHLENGLSMAIILRAVRTWLQAQKTTNALKVAASIIKHAGKRADVYVLLDGSDGSQLAAEIIDDTRYAIRRRTLA